MRRRRSGGWQRVFPRWQHRRSFAEKTKKKKNCNKTADKNIKLHHVTAELGRAVGEEDEKLRDTTFWRERVNFIVAPSQSFGSSSSRTFCTSPRNFQLNNLFPFVSETMPVEKLAITYRIKLMFVTERRVFTNFFKLIVLLSLLFAFSELPF